MQAGFARKYAIMEELDGGFGAGSTPEAFVRLDSWEGRIQATIHVKGLKQGPFKYRLYLIFADRGRLKPILLGDVNTSYNGMQSGLEIDAQTLVNNSLRPEYLRYAALTAESQNKKWIPLFSSFEKGEKWDESIRQVLIMSTQREPEREHEKKSDDDFNLHSVYTSGSRTRTETQESIVTENTSASHANSKSGSEPLQTESKLDRKEALAELLGQSLEALKAGKSGAQAARTSDEGADNASPSGEQIDSMAYRSRGGISKRITEKSQSTPASNLAKLEGMLSNNYEVYHPFKRANKGYIWYKVSDLAQLSNIMYMAGINVPLFANPKILVGLFKYKHILAGIYKGDTKDSYYVIGVPAKNDKDNKPFENACRWAPVEDSEIREMTGYWLIYVSIDTGQIVV